MSDFVYKYRCFRFWIFFFQAEDGIRDLVRSRGLGDVYKRQEVYLHESINTNSSDRNDHPHGL